MAECPHCEYNKKRAQIWRDEVYRLVGHPLPRKETMTEDDDDIQDYKKPWVGLTDDELSKTIDDVIGFNSCVGWEEDFAKAIEAKLKEKNT